MSLLMKWGKLIKKIHFWDLPAESAMGNIMGSRLTDKMENCKDEVLYTGLGLKSGYCDSTELNLHDPER